MGLESGLRLAIASFFWARVGLVGVDTFFGTTASFFFFASVSDLLLSSSSSDDPKSPVCLSRALKLEHANFILYTLDIDKYTNARGIWIVIFVTIVDVVFFQVTDELAHLLEGYREVHV